jgi:hypothetical protein
MGALLLPHHTDLCSVWRRTSAKLKNSHVARQFFLGRNRNMRALLSLLWSPSRQSATPFAVVREPNRQDGVEYYCAVLAEIAANDTAYMSCHWTYPSLSIEPSKIGEQPQASTSASSLLGLLRPSEHVPAGRTEVLGYRFGWLSS